MRKYYNLTENDLKNKEFELGAIYLTDTGKIFFDSHKGIRKELIDTGKIIIAGLPGIGRSKAASMHPEMVLDLDLSDYFFIEKSIPNDKGKTTTVKIQNPIWLDNYISAIKASVYETEGLKDFKDLTYVCISVYPRVLNSLRKKHIPFVIVIPKDKDDAIARYNANGECDEFTQQVENNWDKWISDLKSYDMPIIQLEKGKYLSNLLFDPGSNYAYLTRLKQEVILDIFDKEDEPDEIGEMFENMIKPR